MEKIKLKDALQEQKKINNLEVKTYEDYLKESTDKVSV